MEAILQQFREHLYQSGYNESTQKTLLVMVQEFIWQQQIREISDVSGQNIHSFYEYLQTRPLKKRSGALSEVTISRYVYALKTLFCWLEITEQINHNPISGIKFKTPGYHVRHPLSREEVQQLFAAAATYKQRAVLHVCYSCGLRKSEAEALNIRDLHFKQQLLYVREGKGHKRRVIPLTARVARELEEYYVQDRCSAYAGNTADGQAFILNNKGCRMRGYTYNELLKQLVKKAGIPAKEQGNITLHHLRHSIATHLLQSGMSMEYVKDFLGHRFLETTQLYARLHAGQLAGL
jgi:integrase/recombinase XerD